MADGHKSAKEIGFLQGGGAFADLIAQYDWSSTGLGPMEAWPSSLKSATSFILNSPLPMTLLVGEDGIVIYNAAYGALIGRRHPEILGGKAREAWPEFAEFTERAMKSAQRGETLSFRDLQLVVQRTGAPQQVWMNIDCSPVRDEQGRYLGVLSVASETTERVLAQRSAEVQFDRLRSLFEQAPGFICILGPSPDYVVTYVNEAHKRVFGDRQAEGKRYLEVFGDLAEKGTPEVIYDVFESGERYVGRGDPVIVPQPDGGHEERFIDMVIEAMRDDAGEIVGVYVEGFDVTPQVRAQAAAAENARHLSAAVAIAKLGTFEWDMRTGVTTYDERAREIYGFAPDETVTPEAVLERMAPEDISRVQTEAEAADEAGQTRREFEYRIRRPDGAIREIFGVSDTITGADGKPRGRRGMFSDVTERRRAEKRQRMLINELNHRVKNTLATVQSIASQTLRWASDAPSARAAFEARLMALSATHDLLTAESWHGARLDGVVTQALAPFISVQRPQIDRFGPAVWLTAPHALALSLALHELATNAAKYGALSVPDGRASVRWDVRDDELTLAWREEGGPPVLASPRSGFGSRLLQRNLARELHGQVDLDFAREGVRCEIRFRVENLQLAAAHDQAGAEVADAPVWFSHPPGAQASAQGA